jgi:hypothetical protein
MCWMREHAAGEELVGDFTSDRKPVAINGGEALLVHGVKRAEVIGDEAKERRGLTLATDAEYSCGRPV